MDSVIAKRIEEWLGSEYDIQTRNEIQQLIDAGNTQELENRFYQDLDFGTGGLRGIIGAGTNRMNTYNVAKVTQGVATYILKQGYKVTSAVIAYDSRHKSPEFALQTALVFAANGIRAYLFESLRPTPLLSFAVRYLKTVAGVMITASHNPPQYNGYKLYWDDGAQVVPPHDKNIISEVRHVRSLAQVKKITENEAVSKGLLVYVGKEIDEAYLEKTMTLMINKDIIEEQNKNVKIAFTPLHGTGITLVPELLSRMGFKNIHTVAEQKEPDPDFSTVKSPNPEETAALRLVLRDAEKIDADIAMATDPDADRIGIAVKDKSGKYVLLSGNQTGSLLVYYILSQLKEKNKLPANGVVIKTIVTTELQRVITESFSIECIDVLTGFKYIGEKIREFEIQGTPETPSKQFIVGGEESYGYLTGTFVRDKDAVSTAGILAELAAYAKSKGTTIYDMLEEIYVKFGVYKETGKSLSYEGKEGMDTISKIMSHFRNNSYKYIAGIKVNYISDYLKSVNIEPSKKQVIGSIELPSSNVLAYHLSDNTKITIRPSGTEPKIKFYFAAMEPACGKPINEISKNVQAKIDEYESFLMDEIKRITSPH